MKLIKKTTELTAISHLAALSALNYSIFVFPNSFAPAGIDGICTMIQDTTQISIGYLSLIVNIPLIIISFIFLNKDFAIKNCVYVLAFSATSIFLRSIDMSAISYHTETGTSIILAPLAAGVIRGILYALTLGLNGASAGTDLVAALIKKKNPYMNLMNIIFSINLVISFASYFVYGMKFEPVICSIIYSFITSLVSNHIRGAARKAIKFEIITEDAKELCAKISGSLHQAATVVDARGVYSGGERKMVVCVVDKHKEPYLEDIILGFPNAVTFKSVVDNTLSGIDYK